MLPSRLRRTSSNDLTDQLDYGGQVPYTVPRCGIELEFIRYSLGKGG